MEKIIEKLSSYNIFNYLFPGAIFVYVSEKMFGIKIVDENIINALFVYYFIGLVISRIGSIIVEPICIKLKIIKYEDYGNYIKAAKNDEKIDILLEVNNMYRTICSLFLSLILIMVVFKIEKISVIIGYYKSFIVIIILLSLFIFSYKKQTSFIVKRIQKNLEKENGK